MSDMAATNMSTLTLGQRLAVVAEGDMHTGSLLPSFYASLTGFPYSCGKEIYYEMFGDEKNFAFYFLLDLEKFVIIPEETIAAAPKIMMSTG